MKRTKKKRIIYHRNYLQIITIIVFLGSVSKSNENRITAEGRNDIVRFNRHFSAVTFGNGVRWPPSPFCFALLWPVLSWYRSNMLCGSWSSSTTSESSHNMATNVCRSAADETLTSDSRYRCRSGGSWPSATGPFHRGTTADALSGRPSAARSATANTDCTKTSTSSRSSARTHDWRRRVTVCSTTAYNNGTKNARAAAIFALREKYRSWVCRVVEN